MRFDGIGDTAIAPGESENFTFVWKSPSPGIENDYPLKLWAYGTDSGWVSLSNLTVEIDDVPPTVNVTVTQEGVLENNLVGDAYQDGTATVIVETNEKVSLDDVTIKNSTDSLLPPLTLVTFDNKTFFGSFEVGEWNDDDTKAVVDSATDIVGNETEASENFCVDTRPPIFLDNGILGLKDTLTQKIQVGTEDSYWTENKPGTRAISGSVEDNWSGRRLTWRDTTATVKKVTVEWDGGSKVFEHVPGYTAELPEMLPGTTPSAWT